jgi:fermentation-respiration switch protein FrsA (DUF1100 family)
MVNQSQSSSMLMALMDLKTGLTLTLLQSNLQKQGLYSSNSTSLTMAHHRKHPEDFVDLDAYGENNCTIELSDLEVVIDWVLYEITPHSKEINANKLMLLGHSRGGGVVILKAAEEQRVKAIATWASVAECKTPWGGWSEEKMNEWKQTGVQHYLNSRTKQQMPLKYQLYEDYINHNERLDILKAINSLNIPVLICHGTKDEAVPVAKAHQLKEAQPDAELFLVDSDHVFGRKHPWTEPSLPEPMQQIVDKTISFFHKW